METVASVVDDHSLRRRQELEAKVRQQVLLPPLAGSGAYKITLQVTDDLDSAAMTSQEIPFEVRGRDVAPSDTLVVRNFHFYRGEEDREPLAVAAYRPGDTLWARFDITGYKLGAGNAVDVDYGISVLSPSGKALFTQDKAAEEKSSSFYPKAYVPGSMNLNLQSTIRRAATRLRSPCATIPAIRRAKLKPSLQSSNVDKRVPTRSVPCLISPLPSRDHRERLPLDACAGGRL